MYSEYCLVECGSPPLHKSCRSLIMKHRYMQCNREYMVDMFVAHIFIQVFAHTDTYMYMHNIY